MTNRAKKAVVLAVALAGASALALPKLLPWWRGRAAGSASKGGAARGVSATPVATLRLKPVALSETAEAVGTLRADEAIELQAEITGKVTAIAFQEGVRVSRGDLLVKLDDAELAAALRRAGARHDLARLKEQRAAQLLKIGNLNQQDYDTALSELVAQDAEVQLIHAQLEKTELRAPFDGIIGLRSVSVGGLVTTTTKIATLQGVEQLKLDFAVPERHAAHLRPGTHVGFTVTGDARVYTGEVYAVEPRVDEATRTVLVRARVDNAGGALRPGALAQVALTLRQWNDALLVPAMAVVTGDKGKTVFIVEGDQAKVRPVETGLRRQELVQITSGLKSGDKVIVAGVQAVKAGTTVKTEDN